MLEVEKFLKKILLKNDTVIVACSTGPDSMCLINKMLMLKEELNLKIICAHVNHNCRLESLEEQKYLEKFCEKEGVIFKLLSLEEFKDNFQDDARKKRQAFFIECAEEYNSTKIFTAHHGDDLIETILMRITRGSNIKGYCGFKVINKLSTLNFYKPLTFITKEKIVSYNKENNIKYFIDKSNESSKYTRNRYRKHILPFLKSEEKNIHLKYLQFSNKLDEYNNFVDKYIYTNKIVEDDHIDLNLYKNEENIIKKRSIELLIEGLQENNELYVTDSVVNEVMKMINSSQGVAQTNLPNSFIGYKKNKKFYIKKK